MKRVLGFSVLVLGLGVPVHAAQIVIENPEMRLELTSDGRARSLIHKETGEECLVRDDSPVFSVTQYRPYDNELQLAYPAKPKTFAATQVRRENNRLLVDFELVDQQATILLDITDKYISFTLEKIEYKWSPGFRHKRETPIDELTFLQLPVRNRDNFGEWLNVLWDEKVAVNLLATNPYTQIESEERRGYQLFRAGGSRDVRLEGLGAALIATTTPRLLDHIAQIEEDFDLPRGVESRRRDEYSWSYYEMTEATPQNIDAHIEFARKGGFRSMVVYYLSFAETSGHYSWSKNFPDQMKSLQRVVEKIKNAGMTPGLHFHYNKAHKTDAYVSPTPDPRLNLRRIFTLAQPLDAASTVIYVEENPSGTTLDEERRLLRIGNELISFENYSTVRPYRFTGCLRGDLNTRAASHGIESKMGLLDVDTWPIFVRFNQETSIQEEVAKRLGEIYQQAGFEFAYFDGAEDVHPPYWFNVSLPQWLVYRHLRPAPLFSEGACKSHFSWHILSRGNAFDVFAPEVMKEAVRAHPAEEAPRMARDFTGLNFGWIGYWVPRPTVANDEANQGTVGTQPDMLEYITSRAAAWSCPISLNADLEPLRMHPRTPDNLEVFRRWEEVRAGQWLDGTQKEMLKDLDQEHILLINEDKKFELVPYEQIPSAAGNDPRIRGFVFERTGKTYIVYWHISGEGVLELPEDGRGVRLLRELGEAEPADPGRQPGRVPVGGRRYLESSHLSRDEMIRFFQNARLASP